MQDKKTKKSPLNIRFRVVFEDSVDPGYRYIIFDLCEPQAAYPEKSIMRYQEKTLMFRQNIQDPSKLEYAIKTDGPYCSAFVRTESFIPCHERLWPHALLSTWKYYSDYGMSYSQKSVYGLTINDGKLSVELIDTDGGLHPPRLIEQNGKPVEGIVYLVRINKLPETFEIDDADNLNQLMM